MSDNRLDDLRVVLRERAGSDPDTEALLAATHAGVRRRRQRRRVAGALGITVGALVVAGVVTQNAGHQHPLPVATPPVTTTPVLHVATPQPLGRPALPFTVGYLPPGYAAIQSWELNPTGSLARYSSSAHPGSLMVTMGTHDRASSVQQPQPVTVNGKPGVLGGIADYRHLRVIVWQITSGEWAGVQGSSPEISDTVLSQVAASITTEPTPVTSSVRIAALPVGWRVQDWARLDLTGPQSGDILSICPPSVIPKYEDSSQAGCAALDIQSGSPPAATQEIVDGTALLVSPDGQTVDRQLDSGHYVEIVGNQVDPKVTVDPSILRQLAMGTSLG